MPKYQKEGSIKFYPFDIKDFFPHLVETISDHFPFSTIEYFSIKTELLPSLSVEEHSIKEFVSHKELPEILNNLTISISNWLIYKHLYLNIDYRNGKRIFLIVEGDDNTWVLGMYALIEEFLKEKEKTTYNKKALIEEFFKEKDKPVDTKKTLIDIPKKDVNLIKQRTPQQAARHSYKIKNPSKVHDLGYMTKIGVIIGCLALIIGFLQLIVAIVKK